MLEKIPGGPATEGTKSAMTNIQKLHEYRQSLVDSGADPKLVQEVEAQINEPATAGKIFGNILNKVNSGEALSADDLLTLDTYRLYGNPMASMMDAVISAQPESIKNKLLKGVEGQEGSPAPARANRRAVIDLSE